eukprot:TRINITY_DN15418_c0_g1_i1.p1 TRINITY_DN15418_c0_g1~~TRINITY_DN15418_c0_g1_i1.p1  ORF type:complete len:991 (-),score=144.61 TRINITY_DN15418_c0_g1_i1:58-3030(-)
MLPLSARGTFKVQDLDAKVRESCGCGLDAVQAGHVARNQELRGQLASFGLSDFFDDRGTQHCRKMGLTFMASLSSSEEGRDWGSRRNDPISARQPKKAPSSKAFMRAQEALERDTERAKKTAAGVLNDLREEQRLLADEVTQRQIEVVFMEVPCFEQYLPPGVLRGDLQPHTVEKDAEIQDKLAFEKANSMMRGNMSHLAGHTMSWRLPTEDLVAAAQAAKFWAQAARPQLRDIGIDRPSFCRFVIESGLVHFETAPLFWAASLFDEVSRPLRCSSSDGPLRELAPVTQVVCSFHLVCIIDTLVSARCGGDKAEACRLLRRIPAAAKARLPEHLFEDARSEGEEDRPPPVILPKLQLMRHPSLALGVDEDGPGARGASRGDDAVHGGISRDELVRSFLVEPEVLHLVAQHFELFSRLHGCYADASGNLSFQGLLQFCTDFHLAPSVASSHMLQHVYESARCLDGPVDPSAAATTAVSPQRTLRASRCGGPMPPSEPRSARMNPPAPTEPRASMISPKARLTPDSGSAPASRRPSQRIAPLSGQESRSRRPSDAVSSGSGAGSQDAAVDRPERRVNGSTSASPPPMNRAGNAASQGEKSGLAAGAGGKGKRASRGARIGVFGPAAFAESLLRIAFAHLEWYGNAQQHSTGGLTRVVWLIAYLRYVFIGLRSSLHRYETHGADAEDAGEPENSPEDASHDGLPTRPTRGRAPAQQPHGSLLAALRDTPDALWSDPPPPSTSWSRSRTVVRPALQVADSLSFSKKQKNAEAKSPTRTRSLKTPRALMRKMKSPRSQGNPGESRAGSKGPAQRASSKTSNGDVPYGSPRCSTVGAEEPSRRAAKDAREQNGTPVAAPSPAAAATLPKVDRKRPEALVQLRRLGSKTSVLNEFGLVTGDPWVESGRCRRCRWQLEGSGAWGRATCFGCSAVEGLDLEQHPFRILLLPAPVGKGRSGQAAPELRAPRAELPGRGQQLHRSPLTPPHIQGSDALRVT